MDCGTPELRSHFINVRAELDPARSARLGSLWEGGSRQGQKRYIIYSCPCFLKFKGHICSKRGRQSIYLNSPRSNDIPMP